MSGRARQGPSKGFVRKRRLQENLYNLCMHGMDPMRTCTVVPARFRQPTCGARYGRGRDMRGVIVCRRRRLRVCVARDLLEVRGDTVCGLSVGP